ncbi:hypothetical protein CRV08_07575 [Halarcobacter ebronensis]|uniref:Uncharacterized protein n=1 Tax=Halarcobacter ebronensis TaxID=1462615 RepID=A0A4Q0YDW5_9BACT|nr:hypothetical protein [Halarcobacter ebronensis]RXJ68672.1 hypothetical protein CRV08_07575 [Halarcobacter ebronensis]
MIKNNYEMVIESYSKSRHKGLVDIYLPKRFYYVMGIIVLFALIIGYWSEKNIIAYFFFFSLYIIYLVWELDIISKDVNDKVRKDMRLEKFNSKELYEIFGKRSFKIFKKRIHDFSNTQYSQIVYFSYLLSDLGITKYNLVNIYEDLKFKTKDYIPITERSSFSAFIALTITLSALGLDKLIDNTKEWTSGAYFGLILTIVLFSVLLMSIYGVFSVFQMKTRKERDIMDNIKYIIDKNMID